MRRGVMEDEDRLELMSSRALARIEWPELYGHPYPEIRLSGLMAILVAGIVGMACFAKIRDEKEAMKAAGKILDKTGFDGVIRRLERSEHPMSCICDNCRKLW